MKMDDEANSIRTQLEKLHISGVQALARELLDARVNVDFDVLANRFQLQVHGYVWAEKLVDVSYPYNWWQAFKDRWFPAWLKKWFPVRYNRIDGYALYPNLRYLADSDEQYKYVRHFREWQE